MGKAFEKQTKRTEYQGKKQADVLKTLKPKEIEAIKNNKSDDNEKLLKNKKIFDELPNERIGEIYNMSKQIDFKNLADYFKSKGITPINFVGFRGPMHIYNNIKTGNTSIEKLEEDQKQFKSNLNEITRRNFENKSKG